MSYASANPQTIATMEHVARSATDFNVIDWAVALRAGRQVFCEVCKVTHESQVVAAEMSRFNLNVAFEAGYAKGMHRDMIPLVDGSLDKTHVPAIIATTLHLRYHEAADILRGLSKALVADPASPPPPEIPPITCPSELLYIMPPYRSDALAAVNRRLAQSAQLFTVIRDDPQEIHTRTLSWYDDVLTTCPAVLVHLLGEDRTGHAEHNQRAAFLAGYCVAKARRVLLLQEASDVRPPIDYRELLGLYRDHDHAVVILDEWLRLFEESIASEQAKARSVAARAQARGRLFEVHLGDPAAENETELASYYVDMSWTDSLRRGQGLVYVGEKGSGKTAVVARLASEFSAPYNFFCSRSFEEYEFDKILRSVSDHATQIELRFAYGALWKYLLLLELASTYLAEAAPRLKVGATPASIDLSRIAGRRSNVDEVETALASLLRGNKPDGGALSVAQALHQRTIPELTNRLAQCLRQFETCHLAIDNVDRLWDFRSAWGIQAMVELVVACQQLRRDFLKHGVTLRVAVLLRDDVHRLIHGVGTDWTKIPVHDLRWTSDALKRVVAARFDRGEARAPELAWTEYVTHHVQGERTEEFILRRVFPRPRDVLVWLNDSLSHAQDAGHTQIEIEDILAGEQRYHAYLLDTWRAYLESLPGDKDEVIVALAEVAAADQPPDVGEILKTAGVPAEMITGYVEALVTQGMLIVAPGTNRQRLDVPLAERLLLAKRPEMLRVQPLLASVFESDY